MPTGKDEIARPMMCVPTRQNIIMDAMTQPNVLPLHEAKRRIQEGLLSVKTLRQACYHQIERFNPELNAFITVIEPPTETDSSRTGGSPEQPGALSGIPIAVKDLFNTKGVRTTGGSRFFSDNVPGSDARAVQRLKEAGAWIIGKTNTHEIALGVTSLNPHFGACRNPWDRTRIPGGSSGGSAVAVATGMAMAALGTDTGGSIRIPASLCGVVGLKPTYGRVSLRGVFPLSWHLDHAGPLTRTVTDAALILQVIAGYDPEDLYCAEQPVGDYAAHLEEGISHWRIALGIGTYIDDAEAEVMQAVDRAAQLLAELGAEVERVDVSYLREAAAANGLMTQADGAAYHRERLAEHPEWFGEDVRRRLEAGRDVPASDYVLARHTQAEMRNRVDGFFRTWQILILPATPISAPRAQGEDGVEQARRLTRFTGPFNLVGLPAISIPCGTTATGLPIGLQMVAGAWQEAALLRAARAYEKVSGWERRTPPEV